MQAPDSFDPLPGAALQLAPGLRRILAPNPSPMTFRGTNTYLLGTRAVAVIDPGPEDAAHLEAILRALSPGQRISHILVTHAHRDHAPLSRRLARECGAPVLAFGDARAGRSAVMQRLAGSAELGGGEGVDAAFRPDTCLPDGAWIDGDGWRLQALWTPGHFGNHLSFAWEDAVFTGDLVMGWASSLVSPPDGDLSDFLSSCARLRSLGAAVFYPGHGAPIETPDARLDWLISHRRERSVQILDALRRHGPTTVRALAARIYIDTPAHLLPAAERNVLAHLVDLTSKNQAIAQPELSADATFATP